ncbi:MAG: acyltransferase [Bacteroidetes bacterium]|nr:acyltransferase [Bacteroidota bacterium]
MGFVFKILSKFNSYLKYKKYLSKLNKNIKNGLKLGKNVTIMPGATIDARYSYLISIGDNCSLSNGVLILAHDATTFKFTKGYTRIGKVEIKDNCFIGTDVIILPGVTIGPNVLIAAGSVVNRNVPPNSCVAGVPARVYQKFDEFLELHKEAVKDHPSFDYKDFDSPDKEFKEKIRSLVEHNNIYVKGYEGKFPWTIT